MFLVSIVQPQERIIAVRERGGGGGGEHIYVRYILLDVVNGHTKVLANVVSNKSLCSLRKIYSKLSRWYLATQR